jgi:hypothetical protein
MCVTALVSLWVNNSAATSIMIPAAIAIIDEVENYEKKFVAQRNEQSHELMSIDRERTCWSIISERSTFNDRNV